GFQCRSAMGQVSKKRTWNNYLSDPTWKKRRKEKSRMNVAHQVTLTQREMMVVWEKQERFKRCRTELEEQRERKRARLEFERGKQRIVRIIPSPEKCMLFSPCRRMRRRNRQADMCRTPDSFVSRISNQSRRSRSPRYSPY
ncbi:unnamed protein product, partial [Allacma fusca]